MDEFIGLETHIETYKVNLVQLIYISGFSRCEVYQVGRVLTDPFNLKTNS